MTTPIDMLTTLFRLHPLSPYMAPEASPELRALRAEYNRLVPLCSSPEELEDRMVEAVAREFGVVNPPRATVRGLITKIQGLNAADAIEEVTPTQVPPAVIPLDTWPVEWCERILASFKVASKNYTTHVPEGRLIKLATARGIPEEKALNLIIHLGREGHWRPRSLGVGNVVWEAGFQKSDAWTVHRDET